MRQPHHGGSPSRSSFETAPLQAGSVTDAFRSMFPTRIYRLLKSPHLRLEESSMETLVRSCQQTFDEIGRASCRERVQIEVEAHTVDEKDTKVHEKENQKDGQEVAEMYIKNDGVT